MQKLTESSEDIKMTKIWDLAGLLHHGAREIVDAGHEVIYFLSTAVSRSAFPH